MTLSEGIAVARWDATALVAFDSIRSERMGVEDDAGARIGSAAMGALNEAWARSVPSSVPAAGGSNGVGAAGWARLGHVAGCTGSAVCTRAESEGAPSDAIAAGLVKVSVAALDPVRDAGSSSMARLSSIGAGADALADGWDSASAELFGVVDPRP
eukprot:scaffold121071_cov18-Tisochrysis_lutea.AAC.1